MPYQIKLSHDGLVISSIYTGVLTSEEIHHSYIDRIRHNEGTSFGKVKIMVGDYTDAQTVDVTTSDIKDGIDILKEGVRINGSLTIIGIMPRDLEYGLSRMWQGYASPLPWTSHVVRTREECDEFIREILEA